MKENKMRNKKIVLSSLLFGVLSIALYCYTHDSKLNKPNLQRDLSGKELFKSIFFVQGNFVNNVETLREIRNNMNINSFKAAEVESVVNKIEKVNPAYFSQFKNKIETQDYAKIEDALNSGKLLLTENDISANLNNENYETEDVAIASAAFFKNIKIQKNKLNTGGGTALVITVGPGPLLDFPMSDNGSLASIVFLNQNASIINLLDSRHKLDKERFIQEIANALN